MEERELPVATATPRSKVTLTSEVAAAYWKGREQTSLLLVGNPGVCFIFAVNVHICKSLLATPRSGAFLS